MVELEVLYVEKMGEDESIRKSVVDSSSEDALIIAEDSAIEAQTGFVRGSESVSGRRYFAVRGLSVDVRSLEVRGPSM